MSAIGPDQAADNADNHYRYEQRDTWILIISNISLRVWTDENKNIHVITQIETIIHLNMNTTIMIQWQNKQKE